MTVTLSRRPRRPSPGLTARLAELGVTDAHVCVGPWMDGRRGGRARASVGVLAPCGRYRDYHPSGSGPRSQDELAEWLGEHAPGLLQSGGRDGAQRVADVIGNYVNQAQRSDGSIAAQMQAVLADFMRDNGQAVDGRLPLGARVTPQSARSARSALSHDKAH